MNINSCPPWEINIKRRWYNTEEDYWNDLKNGLENSLLFKNELVGSKKPDFGK
jgi:hypothetical protein